jgi:hypothetical protein
MARESKHSLKRIPAFHSEDEETKWYSAHRGDLHENMLIWITPKSWSLNLGQSAEV